MSKELDAQASANVAERVMGWSSVHIERHGDEYHAYGKPPDKDFDCTPVPRFTTDLAADYEVLKRMRENSIPNLSYPDFCTALVRIWKGRFRWVTGSVGNAERCCLCYEPGDYSRAAFAALTPKEPT